MGDVAVDRRVKDRAIEVELGQVERRPCTLKSRTCHSGGIGELRLLLGRDDAG